jgi:hypothetical protein
VRIVDVRTHHRAQDAAAPMGRIDADDGRARAADPTARNRHLERETTCAADDPSVFTRREHPVEREHA